MNFSEDHGVEVIFTDLATKMRYTAKGYAAMNEVILIN